MTTLTTGQSDAIRAAISEVEAMTMLPSYGDGEESFVLQGAMRGFADRIADRLKALVNDADLTPSGPLRAQIERLRPRQNVSDGAPGSWRYEVLALIDREDRDD